MSITKHAIVVLLLAPILSFNTNSPMTHALKQVCLKPCQMVHHITDIVSGSTIDNLVIYSLIGLNSARFLSSFDNAKPYSEQLKDIFQKNLKQIAWSTLLSSVSLFLKSAYCNQLFSQDIVHNVRIATLSCAAVLMYKAYKDCSKKRKKLPNTQISSTSTSSSQLENPDNTTPLAATAISNTATPSASSQQLGTDLPTSISTNSLSTQQPDDIPNQITLPSDSSPNLISSTESLDTSGLKGILTNAESAISDALQQLKELQQKENDGDGDSGQETDISEKQEEKLSALREQILTTVEEFQDHLNQLRCMQQNIKQNP